MKLSTKDQSIDLCWSEMEINAGQESNKYNCTKAPAVFSLLREMDGCLAVSHPFQQYFSHIKMMGG